jgi:hypothetical protein
MFNPIGNTSKKGHRKPKIQKSCAWCATSSSLQWRSGPEGICLCNRCGLQYRRIKDCTWKEVSQIHLPVVNSPAPEISKPVSSHDTELFKNIADCLENTAVFLEKSSKIVISNNSNKQVNLFETYGWRFLPKPVSTSPATINTNSFFITQAKKLKPNYQQEINPNLSSFNHLPKDLKFKILDYLPLADQLNLSSVSKECEMLINNEILWKNNLNKHFVSFNYFNSSDAKEKYKSLYIFYHNLVKYLYDYIKNDFEVCHKFNDKGEYDETISPTKPDENVDISQFVSFFRRIIYCQAIKSGFFENLIPITEIFIRFLHYHPNINEKYGYGFTLLHLAAALPNYKIVYYLLKNENIDPYLENNYGKTPLKTAILFCKILESSLEKMPLARQYSDEALEITKRIIIYKKTIKTFLNFSNSETNYWADAYQYATEIDCQSAIGIFSIMEFQSKFLI